MSKLLKIVALLIILGLGIISNVYGPKVGINVIFNIMVWIVLGICIALLLYKSNVRRHVGFVFIFFLSGILACVILLFMFTGTVVIRHGVAEPGQAFMNPLSVERCYHYPWTYKRDYTVALPDRSIKVRLFTKRTNDEAIFYYHNYGLPEDIEDSLRFNVGAAIRALQSKQPTLSDRQLVAGACEVAYTPLGFQKCLLVLPEDSLAFEWKK
jgi:hypothetical protein